MLPTSGTGKDGQATVVRVLCFLWVIFCIGRIRQKSDTRPTTVLHVGSGKQPSRESHRGGGIALWCLFTRPNIMKTETRPTPSGLSARLSATPFRVTNRGCRDTDFIRQMYMVVLITEQYQPEFKCLEIFQLHKLKSKYSDDCLHCGSSRAMANTGTQK
jgi:hypothetical protein